MRNFGGAILVTGGCGYIGSNVIVELLKLKFEIVIVDDLSNSSREVVSAIETISGRSVSLHQGDVRDFSFLCNVFAKYDFSAVVHLAGLKSVSESQTDPLSYFSCNVAGSINLFRVMSDFGISDLVFSSSATVYGSPLYLPIDENHPTNPNSNYGRSKLMVENILQELVSTKKGWRVLILRYFNPAGAHLSGLLGDNPKTHEAPANLIPFLSRVASGCLPVLNIYGTDYETADGTGIRDYIHISDLAEAHSAGLQYVLGSIPDQICTLNVGTGRGFSVKEVVRTYGECAKKQIPQRTRPRRSGDVEATYADITKAISTLDWKPTRGLEDMCRTMINFENSK